MAILNVNSNRMQLNRLKQKLKITIKAHTLMKNKCDKMLRIFSEKYKNTVILRKNIQENITKAEFYVNLSKIYSQPNKININWSNKKIKVNLTNINILGVLCPKFSLNDIDNTPKYSFFSTSSYLDKAINIYMKIFPKLIKLSEQEKTLYILSNEIKKTRKKVNAIQHIFIPNFKETIKYISLKLEETERNNIARLNKIKI